MSEPLPLEGIRVFDATQGVAGPHATLLLARQGADVVKVEPPEGEWGRTLGRTYGEHCAHSVLFNRGKRSIAIDLKHPEGVRVARRLAERADVVAESFRPGVMDRFGLGWETLREANPALVYLSVTGFGQQGPYRDLPVTDSVIQAFSGWMSINRDAQGTPQRIGMVAIDVMTGLYAYQALAGALFRKIRFGRGERLDVSLMQAAAAFQAAKIAEHHLEEGAPQVLYVPVGTMKTRDGYINITAMRERHYRSLMEALGMPELASDPRFDTREKRIEREGELMPVIRRAFLERTTAEWARILTDAGVMNAPVHTYGDFMKDPHVQEVGALAWLEQPGVGALPVARTPATDTPVETPGGLGAGPAPEHPAPGVGEHSREILLEAGLGEAEVEGLARSGAIRLGAGRKGDGRGPAPGEAAAAGD